MAKEQAGKTPINWRAQAANRWPGLLAVAAYLACFALFPFWSWLALAPLAGLIAWMLRADDWPALLTTLLYVLCFPHARLGFLGFVCFVPLLRELPRRTNREFFRLVWIAGAAANVGKLYWLVHTISYFSPIPFPAAVLILLLLCSTLGLFWAIHFRLTHWLVRERGLPLWLVFPAGWAAWDYFLTYFLGGFPWEVLGGAAYHIPVFNQTFDLFGEFALSWLLAFGNVVAAELFAVARRSAGAPAKRPVLIQAGVLVGLVAAGFIYGAIRTAQIKALMPQGREIRVGLLQGNVDQSIKWKPGFREKIMDDYALLAQDVTDQGAELIVMPETSIPRRQERWLTMEPDITRYATETKRFVLAGVPSNTKRLNRFSARGPEAHHNSAVLLAPDGDDLAWYDKNRLVPFGEYIPKKHLLQRIVGKAIKGTLNFEEGGHYTLMPYPGAPFAVFICYESIYPSTVRRLNTLGAEFLVTITNDAWFGHTSSPHQHWAQVAMRAIESRRWVARAANTGISGIIDPLGRTVMHTPLEVRTSMLGSIRTMRVRTLYGQVGDAAAWLATALYLAALAFGGFTLWRRRRRAPQQS